METIKEALTFDDVLLLRNILTSYLQIQTYFFNLLKNFIKSSLFLLQWILYRSKMAMAIAREGGLGIIHKQHQRSIF